MADQVGTVTIGPSSPDYGEDPTIRVETEPPADAPGDAPWGYKDDGTPYKVDPARYRKRDAKRRGAAAPTARPAASKGRKASQYRDSVLGLTQIVGLPLAAAATQNDVFLADLVALNETAPGIADAVDQIAQSNPKFAAALDKLAEVGPYGLLIGALAPLVLQVAANHGAIPVGVMGTVDPQALVDAAMPPDAVVAA